MAHYGQNKVCAPEKWRSGVSGGRQLSDRALVECVYARDCKKIFTLCERLRDRMCEIWRVNRYNID